MCIRTDNIFDFLQNAHLIVSLIGFQIRHPGFNMAANVTNNTSRFKLPPNYRCFHPMFPVDFQYQYFKVTHTVATPLNVACMLFSLIFNCLILITVSRRRRLRAPSSLLLYSLNLKDISFVALGQTLQIYASMVYLIKDNFCASTGIGNFSLSVIFSGRAIGLISMIVISIDRCFAIQKPHVYRRGLNRKRVAIVVIIVWLFSIAIGAITPFLQVKSLSLLMMMLFGATAVAVTLLQLNVYYSVKRRVRVAEMNSAQLRQMALEKSVAIVVFYIILGLAICYIPFLTSLALILFKGQNYVYFARIWLQFCIYLNGLINPIVMLKTNRQLRAAVLHTISPCLSFCSYSVWDDSLAVESVSRDDKQQRTTTQHETTHHIDKIEDNNDATINLDFVRASNLLD